MEHGFIKLSRKFFENEIWQAARAFNGSEAWLDLIQSARFEASDVTRRFGVLVVTWGRGQYPASNRFLAKKWGRSEQWVKTFLSDLKKKKMITTDHTQGMNIITLVNYEKYNVNPLSNPPNNPPNELANNNLEEMITQCVTHQITQRLERWQKTQPTSNPNTKKEKELNTEEEYSPYNPPEGESVNYKDVVDLFNRMFNGILPRVTNLTEERVSEIKARIRDHGVNTIDSVFFNARSSPFLLGENNKGWRCDFDWIFKPSNYVKILEGNYLETGKESKISKAVSNTEKALKIIENGLNNSH